MISDDERREVASRMREILRDDPHCWLDAMVMNAVTDVMGDGEKIGETVADLIDRPTCRMSDIGDDIEEVYRCSACGEEYFMSDVKPYPWRFCPNCGAMVTESGCCDVPEL